MFLERMKWPEIDALDRANVLVVCCIGALEQHGLHLPMGTDYMIGSELLRRLEEQNPSQLLCLPALWLGCSDHHMGFAGTITAPIQLIIQTIQHVASSIRSHGFQRMLFLNTHGGNRASLSCSIQDLGRLFPDLTAVGATYWEVASAELEKLRASDFGGMGHACELETSLILAIDDTLVDRSRTRPDGVMAKSCFTCADMLHPPAVTVYKSISDMSENGCVGDPTVASAEKGRQMFDVITDRLAYLCRDILANQL